MASAEVTLSASSFSASVKTDSVGCFHFDSAPRAALKLTVRAKGFAPTERGFDLSSERPAQLQITLTPASIAAQVTITATRAETRLSDTAASVVELSARELATTAAITLDDALRQTAGLSLFRRSGSRTANPTSQGVSLRGLGASGASRAVVLVDAIPLNDPFGGWVYWGRVPRESIERVEVVNGGASGLYGSGALGGAINIITRKPEKRALSLEASYGNENTQDASLFAGERFGRWTIIAATEWFRTDGYVLVDPGERGPIDTPAASRHAAGDLRIAREVTKNFRAFIGASYFGESRSNGTPLQTNRTHIRQFSAGSDWQSGRAGSFSARVYGGTQLFDQNFSAVNTDRTIETLTRLQRSPAQSFGLSLEWSRPFADRQTIVAGFEAREVRGSSDEIVYTSGRAASLVGAGGRQRTSSLFLEDIIKASTRLFITAGARLDHWRNFDALSTTTPLSANPRSTVSVFLPRTETAFSPHASLLYKRNERVSLSASAYRAFRAPTLNELYRSFRVGNVLTLANDQLLAERLTGGEAGVGFNAKGLSARTSFFWSEITRPVANVTIAMTPALITRQRQNLGRTRSRGVEIEVEAHLNEHWTINGGYLYADSTVLKFPANTTLEGLRIPQVPRHQMTFQVRYENSSLLNFGLQGRASSEQFDDDQNQFRLSGYFTLDAFASRHIARGLEAFAAIENLFNRRYEVGKTPVTTLGPPILVRAGFRVHLPGR